MGRFSRVIIIVLDSAGVGELPDAGRYGDEGSGTLPHTARAVGGLRVPQLEALGLGRIVPLEGVRPLPAPRGAYGKLAERSAGKDSTTGHWELMGVIVDRPFPTYPKGFPADLIAAFERAIRTSILGNEAASGTEIIARLGPEHQRTGYPIVYTSADSVFQVAAHEDVIPVQRLYEICLTARRLLTGPHAVSRVIARPFVGSPGAYTRTDRRRDFSLPPTAPTVLDAVTAQGLEVVGIGKISDLFAGRGVTRSIHTRDDLDGMAQTGAAMTVTARGIIFTNLVDLDSKFGHRNDPAGYARDLEAIDAALPQVMGRVRADDLVVITADHGNDPTTGSTDHAREYVPLLFGGPAVRGGVDLGVRSTFADVGATVADALGIPWEGPGTSVLPLIAK
ncbi:MAG: phosphopentomutase [Bacillati bacterium ANGP1]|uniref:Phosphopentomutase n=2 Tax=Candidatus Segetimicrobium genomatis TaxID=2569760 RepID=A0A537LR56_9BACT|nr:MAG: phosphopentomutase [Terrabacteria group bacterium ANGP1]